MDIEDEAGLKRMEDGRIKVRAVAKCPKTGKYPERHKTLPAETPVYRAVAVRESLKEEIRNPNQTQHRSTESLLDWIEQWLEAKASKMSDSTLDRYKREIAHHIAPHLGDIYLSALTRADIKGWVEWASQAKRDDGEHYSTASVRSWWRTLRMILRDADAEGHLEEDITRRIDPPTTPESGKRETRTLDTSELTGLVELAPKVTPFRAAEIITLALTGMRAGELYGLEWRDLEFGGREVGIISIERTVWRGDVQDSTKTGVSRDVPALPRVQKAIEGHRERLMRRQHPGLSDGIVFPSDAGTRRSAQSLYGALDEVSAAADIDQRVTPQVLRRSFNTLLQTVGLPDRMIREMLGHTTERMTTHYSQFSADQKAAGVSRLLDVTG